MWVLGLSLLCLLLYLPCLGNRDLWGTVETEYAEVARETLVEGHWIVPHYAGEVYARKPPLYFWLMALASVPLGDVTEFTARLPSALSALGTVLIVFLLGRELLGEGAGLLAALILASAPQYYKSACMVRIDMPLAFFATSSLAFFYFGLVYGKKVYPLLGWFALALTFLIKGPLVLGLVVVVVFSYLFSRGELHRLKDTRPLPGAFVFILAILLWLLPAYLQGGYNYVKWLLDWLGMYVTEEPHAKPFYFYIPELLGGFGPWSIFILIGLYMSFKRQKGVLRLPCLWLLIMLVAFSLIASKHSRYLLPLYPAAALLAAAPWRDYLQRDFVPWPMTKALFPLLFSVLLGLEIALFEVHMLPLAAYSLTLGSLGLAIGLYLVLKAGQFRPLFASILVVLLSFEVGYYQFLLPRENSKESEKALCQGIVRVMEPGAQWAVYKAFRPAYIFYTRSYPRCINSEADLDQFLSVEKRTYCLIREEDYQKIRPQVFKIAEFKGLSEEDPNFILVSNRPEGKQGL